MDCENLTKIKLNLSFSLTIFIASTCALIILGHNIQYVADIDLFYVSTTGRFTFTNSSGQYESEHCDHPRSCAVLLKEISQRTSNGIVVYSVIYNFTENPLSSIQYYTTNTLYAASGIVGIIVIFSLILLSYNRKWKKDAYWY